MLLVYGLVLALSSVQAPQAADSTGRIAGRVTIEGTNTPIAGARIFLVPRAPRTGLTGPPPNAITDADGRFVLDRVAPGTYDVDVQKAGFVPLSQPGQRSRTIDVGGERAVDLDLQLQKGGVIAGRVLDPSGEPMAEVRIMALVRAPVRPGAQTPRLMPVPGPGAQTNDIGEFRVSGLAAGEYYLAATSRGASPFGGPAVTPSAGNARTTIAATFYPGTTSPDGAQPVAVAAGAEVANVSFAMQSAPAFRVEGVVVDENGDPVAGAMVMMLSVPPGGMFMGSSGGAQSQSDGRFAIGEVTAGSYRLTASIPIRMTAPGVGGGFVAVGSGGVVGVVTGGVVGGVTGGVVGDTEVVVTDADLTGVRVVVRRPARQ
jgi:carboxypeptidase family protein